MCTSQSRQSRRDFLKTTAALAALPQALMWTSNAVAQPSTRSANEQLQLGLIGVGYREDINRYGRGFALGREVNQRCGLTALCDVDKRALVHANELLCKKQGNIFEDYRDLIARDDLDAVIIATPDHWHTKMAADAMRAGKDVYVEKPATLTIAEGRVLSRIVAQTGRVLQVGTQQRTEYNGKFAIAAALVQQGRIGQLQRIVIGVDPGEIGGPFQVSAPPKELNWDMWLGPAPMTDYIKERTHWTFRWWYEYAGGKLTDWGAHHVDIAHWAMNLAAKNPGNDGLKSIQGKGEFQVPYEKGSPTRSDLYNTPSTFEVSAMFPGGVEMVINSGRNGITFHGSEGRFFVNRGTLEGTPIDRLGSNSLPSKVFDELYRGERPESHMKNFLNCIRSRKQPMSDIESHHRAMTTCHLANLTLRLQKPLKWDSQTETILDDQYANSFVSRQSRAPWGVD